MRCPECHSKLIPYAERESEAIYYCAVCDKKVKAKKAELDIDLDLNIPYKYYSPNPYKDNILEDMKKRSRLNCEDEYVTRTRKIGEAIDRAGIKAELEKLL